MCRLDKEACFDGRVYRLTGVVEHVSGADSIALCCSESGELRFASVDEWRGAALPIVDVPKTPRCDAAPKAPVTHESSLAEKVSLVMSVFRGRTDVYGDGYVGKDTKPGKLNYWPRCKLRWVRGACPKLANSKAKCSDCDHPSYEPLTYDVVAAHCTGRRVERGRIKSIGIYVVDGDVCYLLAADFDGPGWQDAASAYRDACRRHGLSPAVERSRSGNGAHVWVFFDGAVKASLARRVGEGLVSEARNSCKAVSFRSYDRLFPLQDVVDETNLGSLIALPLQGEAVRKGNSVFVDDEFETLPDQCAYLSSIAKAKPEHIAVLAEEFGKDPIGLPEGTSRKLTTLRPRADASQPRGVTAPSNGPSTTVVKVVLADGVHIECKDLPARVINGLRRLAAFRNPEYTRKLRLHLSVHNTPRFVDLSTSDDEELVLPRGCTKAALSMLREAGAEPFVADGRAEGRRIHAHFLGELRKTQEPCRDKLIKHDLGVLIAPTGFGKSVIAASIIATHQVSTLVIVPTTALLEQWRESLTKFLAIDDEPPVLLTPKGRKRRHQPGVVGIIGGGKSLRSGIVDVALAGSLFEIGDVAGDMAVSPLVGEYGMVIVDEAQHVAASKVLQVLGTVRAHYVYGMTATPKRDDGLDRILFLECGPLRHEVAVAEQIEEQGIRRLLVPRLTTTHPDLEATTTWHALMDYVCANEERNHLVASDAVRALRNERTPLVLTRRVEHARVLAKLIEDGAHALGAHVALLVGADADAIRRQRLADLHLVPHDSPLCVVATGSYVGEGFDLDRLDTLLLAGPVVSEGTLFQWVGRLHRVREGKMNVIVMDYVDPAIPMFDGEWRKRLKAYGKLGYQAAREEDLTLIGLESGSTLTGHLFTGKTFLSALERDLSDCGRRVVIASSWAKYARTKSLRPLFECMLGSGVSVSIVAREPSNPSTEWQQALATLRDSGCRVQVISNKVSLDCVVIDDALVWYGGVAPLAYPRRDDCSLRIVNREVAASLIEALGVEE